MDINASKIFISKSQLVLNKDVGSPLEVVFLLSGHLIRLLLLAVCKAFPGKAFGRSWFLLKYLFFFYLDSG